jgi:hypothetical protein
MPPHAGHDLTMTDRVRALLMITPDGNLLTILRIRTGQAP